MNYRLTTTCVSAMLVLLVGITADLHAATPELQRVTPLADTEANTGAAAKAAAANEIYIVQLVGDPVIAYDGGIRGYQATKPGKGKKINPNSAHVKKYAAYLEQQQDQIIHSAGGNKVYNYRYAFNGFAARMSAAEAEALTNNANVLNVWKDEIRQIQTDNSPTYIGLTGGGDAWSKGHVGEDVVIGVIDTGIWPEHPSFADVATPKKGNKGPAIPYDAISSFTPSGCDFGNAAANPEDAAFSCNNKLLAARCYNVGFSTGPDATNPCGGNGAFTGSFEFQSARDVDGHGSHTASTAGGNNGVPAFIAGEFRGNVSGIAPRARIAVYKVCWDGPDPTTITDDGCASSDSAAAIDQAAADGVDVINFSIGGASNNFNGADDIAFLFAANAGVFVATSNGNAGPGAGTVGTPSGVPWITAVGASQDSGVFYNSVTVNAPGSVAGEYVAVEGAGPVSLADTGPISDAVTHSDPVNGCGSDAGGNPVGFNNVIDGIALVSRGTCSFSEKYNNAALSGADAIIVYNDGANSSRIDPFVMSAPGTTIPGVMIGYFDGLALAGAAGVNATLDADNAVPALNRIAGFSSRGPNNGELDIIKPDIAAPGVAILAAETPANGQNELFQSINGTSMASPHIAGSFALLKQAHPDWSPAMARSALMTTARQNLNKTFGDAAADPFDIGAGEVVPSAGFDPGLAYDANILDYARYTCGSQSQPQIFSAATCAAVGAIDPSDLNLPSIGIGELVGSQTVTRTVTSVANNNGNKTFTVSVDAPPGIDVIVSPSTIKLRRGQTATYEVTFTANSAAVPDQWAFGSLTWTHGGEYSVRSPVAVRPVAFSTVDEVDGEADGAGDGSVGVPVTFGYAGDYSASVSGLEAGFSAASNLTAAEGVEAWCANLPANTHFRTALFDEDTSDPGNDDLDLELFYLPNGCGNFAGFAFIGSSLTPTSEESVDFANGPAGGYHVQVRYFSASNGNDSDYVVWFQPVFGDAGNTTVTAPGSAVLGSSDVVTVEYSGLAPTRNLGILHHADGSGEIARTILDIDAR